MKQLYFIRHGFSEMNKKRQWSGHNDTPLTPEGHEQAKRAGQKAKAEGLSFDIIVSSPLQRAHHTAQHVASHIGYSHDQIILNDLFKERHYGRLDGKRHNIRTVAPYALDESYLDKFGGESLADLQKRADDALAFVMSLDHDTVLVVAHGSFGRAFYRSAHGLPITHRHTRFKNAELMRFI